MPCERVFSSAKETLMDHRSCILPELMEGLQLLKYSVKHGHSLSFTAGDSWDEERAMMEKLMEIDGDAPENLKTVMIFSLLCTISHHFSYLFGQTLSHWTISHYHDTYADSSLPLYPVSPYKTLCPAYLNNPQILYKYWTQSLVHSNLFLPIQ